MAGAVAGAAKGVAGVVHDIPLVKFVDIGSFLM
jgi:hypothetical protein